MDPLIARLGLALAIGLLVGLERGWRERDAPDRSRTAGIRTYGISGLLGGIVAALSEAVGSQMVLVAGILVFGAIFAWYKAREASRDDDFSVTAVVAALAVFALGALAVAGDYRAAGAGAAALAGVLASREVLHSLLKRLTWIELRSALVLAVMTAVILPLLPDRNVDPWGGVNPQQIWFFTVLTAAISFLGYVAVRMLGRTRGLLVAAMAGAVVSSTAVTVSLGRTAKTGANPMPLAGAGAIAAAVSILRVCTVVTVVAPSVIPGMVLPALAALACFAAVGALLLRRSGSLDSGETTARNPFELMPLFAFALLFTVVAATSAALAGRLGNSGLLATSTVSGLFDVDVAVLSTLRLVGQVIEPGMASTLVLAALAANALGRLFLAIVVGPLRYSMPLAAATAAAITAGYAVHALLPTLAPLP
jgi:uncharacterized membrane protein (DUF4010 family)